MKDLVSFAVSAWVLVAAAVTGIVVAESASAGETVDFESGRWVLQGARVVDYLGRRSLAGSAYLEDVEFEDGVLEVDIAVDGKTSYPGFVFRMQSAEECERFYVRPHRLEVYSDVLQYTPVFNGNAGWQLYWGPGYTAGAAIPRGEWVHLRLEVEGTQAAVFVGVSEEPALIINRLEHGASKGKIGVMGPADGTAYFSNFQYTLDGSLTLPKPAYFDSPPGAITRWSLSQTFLMSDVDVEVYPGEQGLAELEWTEVAGDNVGLVDVSRYRPRSGQAPDLVFARTVVRSETDRAAKMLFGYSDLVSVFLNGRIFFTANNGYRYRDPSATGVVGPYDALYLPLRKGDNELLLAVAEGFGGWGFLCWNGEAVWSAAGVLEAWRSSPDFKIPESVAYDPSGKMLYVSNYDAYNPSAGQGKQFISRIAPDGEVVDREWVGGLNNPTGLAVRGGTLFAVDRAGLVEIDIQAGEIINRYPAPQPRLLNDLAIDPEGAIYVSDSRKGMIYRFADGWFEEWLSGPGIEDPNGLFVDGPSLIVGNNGDASLKAVDIASKSITTIARFASGTIDGIEIDEDGNYLVSHVEGRLYRVSPAGEVTKLRDQSGAGIGCADFDYIRETRTAVIPTFTDNRVEAVRLTE